MANIIGKGLQSLLAAFDRSSLPQIEGTFDWGKTEHEVEILRDRWGVPHIYAKSAHDLFFAQGVVQAQERLFQMELNRRTAQGTLSEVLGDLALETDRAVRTFGFNRLGSVDWANASEEMQAAVLAYCDGVNTYLEKNGSKLPVEFKLLGYQPKPWQPQDCTAFGRVIMWELSHAWHGEIVRYQIQQKLGIEDADEIEIHYPSQNPITLPLGIEFNLREGDGKLISEQGPFLQRGQGSNSWVVAKEKTIDGHTYLYNDMHLPLSMPGLWFQVHLNGGGYQVTGVSLPGIPGILVGHNDQIAWGMTLAFIDCEDLYLEKMEDQHSSRYLFGDEWVQSDVIEEVINVKGKPQPYLENVIMTRHGPIVSDVVSQPNIRLALRSMALRPSPSLAGWLSLDRAKNWDEFVLAMHQIEAPQLSVSYADRQGNIGYWMTGRAPIRAKGDGRTPAPGWDGEYEWVGEVPFEEMPHALNPQQGYLVHTNNKIVGDDYPYYLGDVWMNGSRAKRIEQVLQSKDKLSREEMCRLHIDYTTLPGRELSQKLQGITVQNLKAGRALEILKSWDGELSAESVGGCVYEVVRLALGRNLLEPALGSDLTEQYLGKTFNPVLLTANEFYGHDVSVILRMLDQPQSWWVQQAGGIQTWVEKSLTQAAEWLESHLGGQPSGWQWGKIHGAVFPHPLGLQKPLNLAYNRGPYPIGGDSDTPCQTAYLPHQPYHNNAWAPSFRQVVDLDDLTQSVTIVPPGQSGHIGSEHYDDLIEPWVKGEYHPQLWTREQAEKEVQGKLVLK